MSQHYITVEWFFLTITIDTACIYLWEIWNNYIFILCTILHPIRRLNKESPYQIPNVSSCQYIWHYLSVQILFSVLIPLSLLLYFFRYITLSSFLLFLSLSPSIFLPLSFFLFLKKSLLICSEAITYHTKEHLLLPNGNPWSSGNGRRLTIKRLWVRILAPDARWIFWTLYML